MVDYNEKLVTLGNLATYDELRKASYIPLQEALCFGVVPEFTETLEEIESTLPSGPGRRALDI